MSEPGETHEIEAKLVVLGDERPALLERIEAGFARAGAGGAPLAGEVSAPPVFRRRELHDRYFDLEGDPLRARDSGLRLREADGRTWLTFKGPAEVRGPGLVERLELEGEWSQRELTRVLDHLATIGVHLPPAGPCGAPLPTLARLGFRLVQARRTVRRSTELVPGGGDAPGLEGLEGSAAMAFELALDEVHYATGTRELVHREVEVEAKDAASAHALPLVVDSLLARFAGHTREPAPAAPFARALQPWTWSKTALGAELDRLEGEGRLAELVDGDALTVEGYVVIDARLRS